MKVEDLARQVKQASLQLSACSAELKNSALAQIARSLAEGKETIFSANQTDLQRSEQENLAAPLLKRLKFDEAKLQTAIAGIESLIGLEDPVGKTLQATELDQDLELYRVTCPIGVIGVIFESRPDALVQIAALCLKSGNGVILKGGTEARETNRVLAEIIRQATAAAGIPENWLQLLESRSEVNELLKLDEFIDLIIPRGSNEFVRYIMEHSRIPVMGHADGICHCYVAADADPELAVKIVVDSKTQYVAVCNALETLLVHDGVAPRFWEILKKEMNLKQVELIGCPATQKRIPVTPATEADWSTEYLDHKLSIKVVGSLDEAINHINTYGSGHTDSIVTKDPKQAARFMALVDSGNVFWNCSTRFSDGFRYGLGAEVGISTAKIHARGPVGLEGLVIYKYQLIGNGQIVADYASHSKTFTHRLLNKEFPLNR
ncbi:MAG TPA: glutamate-5-semialdehyde dehydrogenase [Bacillota bacterium]|nr:glutamate-5-semialdehyde dehydrogenase [Bacillota bacterium]